LRRRGRKGKSQAIASEKKGGGPLFVGLGGKGERKEKEGYDQSKKTRAGNEPLRRGYPAREGKKKGEEEKRDRSFRQKRGQKSGDMWGHAEEGGRNKRGRDLQRAWCGTTLWLCFIVEEEGGKGVGE